MNPQAISASFWVALLYLLIGCANSAQRIGEVKGVVRVLQGHSAGTGTLIAFKGCRSPLILTNRHVLPTRKPIELLLGVQRVRLQLKPWLSAHRDLAVLRLNHKEAERLASVPSIRLPSRRPQRVGADPLALVAIGYPIEAPIRVVSGRLLGTLATPLVGGYDLVISHDLQQGMSGGPLLDGMGRLVGINSLHASPAWDVGLNYENKSTVASDDVALYESNSMAISAASVWQLLFSNRRQICELG